MVFPNSKRLVTHLEPVAVNGALDLVSLRDASLNPLPLLRHLSLPRPLLRLRLRQQPKPRLAPGEVDIDVQQGVAPAARARELVNPIDAIGLAGDQRHRFARHMVRRRVHAENQIAGADRIAHGTARLSPMGETRHHPHAPRRHRPCRGRAGREGPAAPAPTLTPWNIIL